MKKHVKVIILVVLVLMGLIGIFGYRFFQTPSEAPSAGTFQENQIYGVVPVKDMPTMVDLGANECIPCKMMVPVMEKVEKKYKGKAAIVFIDVWKDKAPAKRFGISAIPTQIFFDNKGKEIYRHVGFMSEEAIDKIFKKMGVS